MKRTKFLLAFATFLAFSISLWITPEANAVPAFARQTGLACSTCHFQHYPALNAYGRAFKSNGYTQIGGEGKVEGEDLSIPDTLNASLVTKVRYQKQNDPMNDSGKSKGQLQFPDEAALLIGGRAGEHIGFLLEASLKDGDSNFASFKMPITYEAGAVKLGVIPFTTDSGGPAYGFELLNTGALRMSRILENNSGKDTSAQMYIGTSRAAEGFAFVVYNDMFFATYTAWAPVHGDTDTGPYLSYLRLAATPKIGDFDIGAGVQWWGGTTKCSESACSADGRVAADAYAVDAQMQGNVGLPLGVYLTYGNAKKSKTGEIENIFNSSTTGNIKAWSALAELGVLPGKATVAAGYRSGKTSATTNNKDAATIIGATYLLAQNVQLQINQSWYSGTANEIKSSGGNSLTTLMLFAAF